MRRCRCFLVPRTFVGRAVLAILSQAVFVATQYYPATWTFDQQAHMTGILMQVTLYLPALGMILSQDVEWPAWLKRVTRGYSPAG